MKLKLSVESKHYGARDVILEGEREDILQDISRWIDDTTIEVIIKNDPDPTLATDGAKFFKLFDCVCAKDVTPLKVG